MLDLNKKRKNGEYKLIKKGEQKWLVQVGQTSMEYAKQVAIFLQNILFNPELP